MTGSLKFSFVESMLLCMPRYFVTHILVLPMPCWSQHFGLIHFNSMFIESVIIGQEEEPRVNFCGDTWEMRLGLVLSI